MIRTVHTGPALQVWCLDTLPYAALQDQTEEVVNQSGPPGTPCCTRQLMLHSVRLLCMRADPPANLVC